MCGLGTTDGGERKDEGGRMKDEIEAVIAFSL